jgi:hypothetical protein
MSRSQEKRIAVLFKRNPMTQDKPRLTIGTIMDSRPLATERLLRAVCEDVEEEGAKMDVTERDDRFDGAM